MASKNAGNTLAGKVAVRSMMNDPSQLDDAAPLIEDCLDGTQDPDTGAGVIAPAFDPTDFIPVEP